jgi:hypothetical protein
VRLIERTEECFDIKPERLAADTAYGSAATLNWLVNEKRIAPHIPVIDKSNGEDGTFSRDDFTFYKEGNVYICPAFNLVSGTTFAQLKYRHPGMKSKERFGGARRLVMLKPLSNLATSRSIAFFRDFYAHLQQVEAHLLTRYRSGDDHGI